MKAIKALILVLALALVSCGVPATRSQLPPIDAHIFVDAVCGGTVVAKEPNRVLALTATHCLKNPNNILIYANDWTFEGTGELWKSDGDVAWIWFYPKDQERYEVARFGSGVVPGDPLWYRGYHFSLNSWTPTLGFLTDEYVAHDGNHFLLVSGHVVHGFSGTGVYHEGLLVGVINIGLFDIVQQVAPWTGITLIEGIPIEQGTGEETKPQLAEDCLPLVYDCHSVFGG